jgi:hypothetical protein
MRIVTPRLLQYIVLPIRWGGYQPGLDAETIRPLRRRPEVADQTKPHRLAALADHSILA